MLTQAVILEGDVPPGIVPVLRHTGIVACDIETSGLDWRSERIATIQLYSPAIGAIVLKIPQTPPKTFIEILEDEAIAKVFHHAPFDLRFLVWHWTAHPQTIICTKVASRLIEPEIERSQHSLKPLLKRHLGITIDKSQQTSNWLTPSLSAEQLEYAVQDVRHLLDLWKVLGSHLDTKGLSQVYRKCMAFLPIQVQLELKGIRDIFAH
ncbi:ribonuclease D [Nonomuraea indica]|uniref:ribonuclease D n=1 Tax=Nonomuraea indica TaxID=1581193 RepID=UPI0015DDAF1D|nr:ribonuclease D [Nonomuraea indica]